MVSFVLAPVLLQLFLSGWLAAAAAPDGPWLEFTYSPSNRTVRPLTIHSSEGLVTDAAYLLSDAGTATFSGSGSWVALDFGKEIGGLISLTIGKDSEDSSFSLAFSESQIFISPSTSDDSTATAQNESYDGVLTVPSPLSSGLYTIPKARERGGFRYMTIVSTSGNVLSIGNVTCYLTFSPHVENLRDYSGYFYAKDPFHDDEDFLTKIWYAGAYTVQMNVLARRQGRDIFLSEPGWANNATLGIAGPVLVDGAKRDRNIWPGDMGIALPSTFVSTGDIVAAKNSLTQLFTQQNATTGSLPYAGPPISDETVFGGLVSDTYHMWTLLGVYNYYLYSGDSSFLTDVWANFTRGIEYIESLATDSGLINITGRPDWSRTDRGGVDSEGNAIYYQVLQKSAELANFMNESQLAAGWLLNATSLKAAFNDAFYDAAQGMYTDNSSTTLAPQDGNALAVIFNLTQSAEQANNVSEGLTRNWNDYGSVSPESPDTISPFIGGFEIQAHFVSRNDERALDFIRLEWGYMLYTNLSVQSTLLEGYTANGSLGYRAAIGYDYDSSYTSHAHGWSTGPTSALTFYVVGLQVTTPQGSNWSFDPHLSGLSNASGGFSTPLGWFGASWNVTQPSNATTDTIIMTLDVPSGTSGVATLPGNGTHVIVDGWILNITSTRKIHLSGGKHNIVVASLAQS